MKINNIVLRNRVVKGWAFTDLTWNEVEAIRKFLATGERSDLPADYHALFDMYKEEEK